MGPLIVDWITWTLLRSSRFARSRRVHVPISTAGWPGRLLYVSVGKTDLRQSVSATYEMKHQAALCDLLVGV